MRNINQNYRLKHCQGRLIKAIFGNFFFISCNYSFYQNTSNDIDLEGIEESDK
jgi:hypothetical protein